MADGIGTDAVLECVGISESMTQALRSTRSCGFVGYVGVPHEVNLPGEELFYFHVGLRGGPALVRRFLSDRSSLLILNTVVCSSVRGYNDCALSTSPPWHERVIDVTFLS